MDNFVWVMRDCNGDGESIKLFASREWALHHAMNMFVNVDYEISYSAYDDRYRVWYALDEDERSFYIEKMKVNQ